MDGERRFNLIEEPWIPVAAGRASLRDVFAGSGVTAAGGTPLEKIAVFKLLQAIAQAAATPSDNDAWLRLGVDGLAERCLAYLEQWHDAFWLYGPEPFLQFPAVKKAKLISYGSLMPDVATGNTSLLFQSQMAQPLDDGQRALLLLVNMSCCFGGKKVDETVVLSPGVTKSASGRPGPALRARGLLHSFLLGRTLRETVWLNLLTQEQVAQEKLYENGVGTPPWEAMPRGEADDIAEALKRSLMGRLVPLARFYLLENDGIRSVEGIQHPDYLQGGMVDPSVTADRTEKKPRMLWADPQKRPWRELPSLLGFLRQEESAGMRCLQLGWCIPRLAAAPVDNVRLWSGGIRVRGNAGEQYLSGSDDVVESEVSLSVSCLAGGEHNDWFLSFQIGMGRLEDFAKTVYASVAGYYKEEMVDPTDRAKRAVLEFWQLAERLFPELVDACNQEGEEARNAVLRKARACVLDCYARACPQETARQLALWARHRPFSGQDASA